MRCPWLGAVACLACLSCPSCADQGIELVPYIEVPPTTSTAYPYEGLEEIELSIARAGDDTPLALSTAAVGEPLHLADVPFGDDLVVHFSGKASGVEIAYGRTCAISVGPDTPVVEPRLYFSRIVRWGAAWGAEDAAGAAGLAAPTRSGGHAYSLPGGVAVIAGGDAGVIELFDPLVTGGFSQLQPQTSPRAGSVLLPFAGGTAIIVGGEDDTGSAVSAVEVLNPEAEATGRQLEDVTGPALVGHAGATLVDDTIIVAGGEEQLRPGERAVTDRAWRFRRGPGGVLEPPEELLARMRTGRARHTMTRLGNELGADILVVGGLDGSGQPVARAELYRPLREAFEDIDGADLVIPRWGHAAVRMPGGFVLIIGGLRADVDPMAGPIPEPEMELYDPIQGSFASAGVLPADAGLTELTVTPLPDGRVLLVGGRDASGQRVDTVLIARLDPLDGQVDISPTDRLEIPRAGHSAVLLCDGTILIAGGTSNASVPAERYNPPSTGRR